MNMLNKIVKIFDRGILSGLLLAVIILCLTSGLRAEDKYKWVPPEAHNAKMGSRVSEKLVTLPVKYTNIPKITADKSKFTKKYVIDLKKYNISNIGKNPLETSKGINEALQYAKKAGFNYITFPKGTYLISEKEPIILDHINTIIDLNGATLQIKPNGLFHYTIMTITYGAENLRLTNGILKGDRYKHDYKTVKGSHEGGNALIIESGIGLEIDNMLFTETSGFCVVSRKGMSRLREYGYAGVFAKHVESGGFSEKGEKIADKTKTRSKKTFDLSKNFDGEFEFGYIFGYGSYQSIFDRNYQAYFYDPDMKFIVKKNFIQYKKNPIPDNAKYLHLEFNQSEVKEAAKHNLCGSISNLRAPVDVHFHHNHMYNNRSLGFAFCGGQRWIMENNMFEKNGGTAPNYGIDFEDGWDLMQDVVFRNNKFKDNLTGDLVVCAGSEMIFEGNEFQKNVCVWGRTHNYTFRNNKFGGSVTYMTRTGVASIHNNFYKNCDFLKIVFNTMGRNDGLNHKPGEPISTPPITLKEETIVNIKRVIGTYFDFDKSKISNTQFNAELDTKLVRFKDCVLENSSIMYYGGSKVKVIIQNCKGTLKGVR